MGFSPARVSVRRSNPSIRVGTLAPLWLDRGVPNARATVVIARLKEADADGLEASDYRTPNFTGLGPDALAEADLKLTQTVLTFVRHLQAGRFPYKRVSQNNIQLPQAPPEPAAIIRRKLIYNQIFKLAINGPDGLLRDRLGSNQWVVEGGQKNQTSLLRRFSAERLLSR